jgi:hypothetical protein
MQHTPRKEWTASMNTPYFPHKGPLASQDALALLCQHRPASVIVAKGQYSPNPADAVRTLFFEERGRGLSKILDAWLSPQAGHDVIRALRGKVRVATGSCSAMYTTRAAIVWADCGDELRLWRYGRLVARFRPREIELRPWGIGAWKKFATTRFSHARGYLSPSWLRRGVRLESQDGRSLPIAHMIDPIVLFDPTYDGLDLMCDANWVRDLARTISEVTAIPLKLDAPLA